MRHYQSIYQQSVDDPDQFWLDAARALPWHKAPSLGISPTDGGYYAWFADGLINTSAVALDRHVEQGRGEQAALIYESPVTGSSRRFSYAELLESVARCAGALRSLGIEQGDRVVIYMPMIPEAVIAMLACSRLGAIHSVVFGGFASRELAVRIDDASPKAIITASYGLERHRQIDYPGMIDEAIKLASHQPEHKLLVKRPEAARQAGGDYLDWDTLMANAPSAEPVPVPATHPLYILYTSGTTGKPKGIVRDTGGHAVAMNYSMAAIYGAQPGDVFWAASDIGWVVGHSYIVYAPLIHGCTTILYEGKPVGTPDAGAFWRICDKYGVNILFAAPTAFRAIRKEDPNGAHIRDARLESLKRVFVAGERLDPPTYHWMEEKLSLPIIDHWWQTETGWAIAACPAGIEQLPLKPGSATVPSPGFNVQILNDNGQPCAPHEHGNIVIKQPLPPGCLPTLWHDEQRFKEAYLSRYPGYYLSGDEGYFDEESYLYVMGRIDDVINVAGHRLSTGEMEEVIGASPDVAECAVVGINDSLKGQIPVAFVITKNENIDPDALSKDIVARVRDNIGAIACLKTVHAVDKLPKTRSGKILRKIVRKILQGEEYEVPSTIEDPSSLDSILACTDRSR